MSIVAVGSRFAVRKKDRVGTRSWSDQADVELHEDLGRQVGTYTRAHDTDRSGALMARLLAALLLAMWCLVVASGILFFGVAGGTSDTDVDRSSVSTLLVVAIVGFVLLGALVATTRSHHRIRSRRQRAGPEPQPKTVER